MLTQETLEFRQTLVLAIHEGAMRLVAKDMAVNSAVDRSQEAMNRILKNMFADELKVPSPAPGPSS